MLNLKFPDTNVVKCVFNLRQNRNKDQADFNDRDIYTGVTSGLKEYYYEVPEYLQGQVKVGDHVVVHCATGYQLVTVTAVNVMCSWDPKTVKPVVAKVDMEPYFKYLDKKEALAVMKTRVLEEAKRLQSMVTYELIAEKNPEFKDLLDTFKSLGGTL